MGDYSTIADGVDVYNLGPITVGSHTTISQGTYLCAGTHDYTKPGLPLLKPPIAIGNGVWVCAQAFVGPGVTVGDNSIVGARAVVTKDVPEGVIVAGNPARVVKARPMPSDDGSEIRA
jgi:putative colanic acid biosynthesis acetyltransferase WcaF